MCGCCGKARPSAARAVVSCAGAYVSGAAGSNECPAGSVRIESQAACSAAAAATGKTLNLVVTSSSDPRGCSFSTQLPNRASFNADAVGAGNPYAQLLCAAAASGAPPSPAVGTHERTARAAAAAARLRVDGHGQGVCVAPRR